MCLRLLLSILSYDRPQTMAKVREMVPPKPKVLDLICFGNSTAGTQTHSFQGLQGRHEGFPATCLLLRLGGFLAATM